MKKNLLYCAFLLASSLLYGQDIGLRMGVLGSTAIPTQIDSGSTGKIIPTFSIGASSYLWRNERFGVLLDIIYAKKSASYGSYIGRIDTSLWVTFGATQVFLDTHIEGPVKGRMDIQYLDIPVQFAYFPLKGFSLMAGGIISPMIAAKDTGTAIVYVGNDPKDPYNTVYQPFDNGKYIRKMDYGATAGLSYQFKSGIFVDVRVQRHFRSLYKKELFTDNGRKELKAYQTGGTVGVGYRLNWKNKG